MAFHVINDKTDKTFNILELKKSNDIIKYFMCFPRKQRLNVKFIIMDMFKPYYKLFKTIFTNAIIITDKFHVVALASIALKYTRIKCMKHDRKNYNKIIIKLNIIENLFKNLKMTQVKARKNILFILVKITDYEIVTYIINTNNELKATYEIYQDILSL